LDTFTLHVLRNHKMSSFWLLAMYRKDSGLHINMRREDGVSLSRSCKYFIHPLKENTNFLSDKEQLPCETA